ncbi:WD repeat-containing protein 27-like [Planoprotostelium fungivorum]|uniref:WD repeat-containing protein 27-like n=1 Tax=Planoprotostelium fungivorum TaxID=1890364 RepID=A0A2P6N6Z0_9EUKA|nr:WD repeat-containing protein 27-like [Planoprotostelium fungivorum]
MLCGSSIISSSAFRCLEITQIHLSDKKTLSVDTFELVASTQDGRLFLFVVDLSKQPEMKLAKLIDLPQRFKKSEISTQGMESLPIVIHSDPLWRVQQEYARIDQIKTVEPKMTEHSEYVPISIKFLQSQRPTSTLPAASPQSVKNALDIEESFTAFSLCIRPEETEAEVKILATTASGRIMVSYLSWQTDCSEGSISMYPQKVSGASSLLHKFKFETSLPKANSATAKSNKKPIVFHKTIKSSGYGVKTNTAPKSKIAKLAPKKGKDTAETKVYPAEADAPHFYQTKHALPSPLHQSIVQSMIYTPNGQSLLSCSRDGSAHCTKLPVFKYHGEGFPIIVHDGSINSVDSSSTSTMGLTAGDDGTAALWSTTNGKDIALRISNTIHSGTSSKTENAVFGSPIRQAKFYYRDKFIMLACKNELFMYKYLIQSKSDLAKLDDIEKVGKNLNKYRLVHKVSHKSQNITAFDVANLYETNMMVSTNSQAEIQVHDMNYGKTVCNIPEAHSKPIHTLSINRGSPSFHYAESDYQLIATSSTDNHIKIWDIRTQKCVIESSNHN